jgi:hypothetical protein
MLRLQPLLLVLLVLRILGVEYSVRGNCSRRHFAQSRRRWDGSYLDRNIGCILRVD